MEVFPLAGLDRFAVGSPLGFRFWLRNPYASTPQTALEAAYLQAIEEALKQDGEEPRLSTELVFSAGEEQ
jgi:hypothetical protein